MKILAFAASSSRQSINKALVTYAAQVIKQDLIPHAEIDVLDLNDFEMPIYSIDRQNEQGIPALAQQFFAKIGEADALLISYAEHNGSYATAYKNIFDWMSRLDMKVFQNKPMIIFSTSPGPKGGASVLKAAVESAPFFGANVLASLAVGSFGEVFDMRTKQITAPSVADSIRQALSTLH